MEILINTKYFNKILGFLGKIMKKLIFLIENRFFLIIFAGVFDLNRVFGKISEKFIIGVFGFLIRFTKKIRFL